MWNAGCALGRYGLRMSPASWRTIACGFMSRLSLPAWGKPSSKAAFHLVTLLLMVPAVLFAPLNGALCNSLPKTRVLLASTIVPLAILTATTFLSMPGPEPTSLIVCWALVAMSSAVNGPVRYAFLPAAAHDTHWPLTRMNGVFEMGSAAAIIGGLILGASRETPWDLSTLALVDILLAVSLVPAFVVRFPSDVRRPEAPLQAVAGFFSDCKRIWNVKATRGCLLGLASLRPS